MNKVLMTIHGGVRSYRQYWGGNQVIDLNGINKKSEPFYVENITNANETLSIVKNLINSPSITMEKSLDGDNWTTLGTTSTTALTQTIQPGEKLYLRATTNAWCDSNSISFYNSIKGVSKVGGNIMSLLYGSSFSAQDVFPVGSTYTFYRLFRKNTNLQDASELILPAITLVNYCYGYIFEGCTSLTTVPKLYATTLAQNCYGGMFSGCTSLTTAPTLPATTLANNCYSYMFGGCTSLTTAPILPATRLAADCYNRMFSGCTSLTTAPALPATTLKDYCYYNMFYGCTSLTTAPALPATRLAADCYNRMFSGCTSLTTAPALPATTLKDYCYSSMFYGCTSLTTAPELPATMLTSYCYKDMFNGCSNLTYIKCLARDISANKCTTNWVTGVAAYGTFEKDTNMTSWTVGDNGIPDGWYTSGDEKVPFYVENITNSNETLSIVKSSLSAPDVTIEKSTDGETWSNLGTTSTTALTQTIEPGKRLYLRSNASRWYGNESRNSITGVSKVAGNIMSLVYGDGFTGNETTFPSNDTFVFGGLFDSNTSLLRAGNLLLPATILKAACYNSMFRGCTNLTKVPKLPADTLAGNCYMEMFQGCTSLNTLPPNMLPATTLTRYCYRQMFQGCTSLTTAPALPATTLASNCYSDMFSGCTSLTTAPELPATEVAADCYNSMFYGCTSLTTAPELPATTLDTYCYSSMFALCTSLATVPSKLPATTLVQDCYSYMFVGCTSLTDAPVLPAPILAYDCYHYMFSGCENLKIIKCLATDISARNCTENWVGGVAASGTFIKDANMSDWTTGASGIPSGWTVQDA